MNKKIIALIIIVLIAVLAVTAYMIYPKNVKNNNTTQMNNTTNATSGNNTTASAQAELKNTPTPTGSDSQTVKSNGVTVHYVITKDVNGVTYYYSAKYGGWYTLSELVQKYFQENHISTQLPAKSSDDQSTVNNNAQSDDSTPAEGSVKYSHGVKYTWYGQHGWVTDAQLYEIENAPMK